MTAPPPPLTAEQRALAQQAFKHQAAGRFAEAAQGYAAVLASVPNLWSACYNLGLVYQHMGRLPDAADMYVRATRLNPDLAEAHNNLGNVLKALKNDAAAMQAYQRALSLSPQLADAAYNLGVMRQARGEHASANTLFRQAVASNAQHVLAWDALYRGLLGLRLHEEAVEAFLAWHRAMPPCPELVTAGLALCRPIGDRTLETRYLALAIDWPFTDFTAEQYAPILGMIQYFDVSREQLLACYRRYDAALTARRPAQIPMLPRRAADGRLRIGYVSADFRRHVMGRWMLEVISKHDRSLVSAFLISTCPPKEYDAVTAEFRSHADGFADISELDDFAAAKSIAEIDLDILVDLAGHTMAARPGIYAHRPARTILTHLGYHGCLGMSAVDYKLTDRIADPIDAAEFQIERPFALRTCVFPFVRVAPAEANLAVPGNPQLQGKFVFAAFTNVLKLSPRCLAVWRRVLEALPEAVLLFSPPSPAQHPGILRTLASAGIDELRIVFLTVPNQDALWRARYREVHAVLDTFPYAGGDTTLAALDMNVPVVTLLGARHSERVGASILTHLGLTRLIAKTDDEFVALAVRLARDPPFMAQTRQHIEIAFAAADVKIYTEALEHAYQEISVRKPVSLSMALTAGEFFQSWRAALLRHQNATEAEELIAVAEIYVELRSHQPDYAPLLRMQGELAQAMGNLALAAECAGALLCQLPDDLDVRLSSAGFLIDDGFPAEALRVLPSVTETGTTDVRVFKLYTRAHSRLGQWQAALPYSEMAIALAPTDVQALFWHGIVLSYTGAADIALTFLNRALILDPDHVEAAYNAGVLLTESGNLRDAETVFRRALAAPATATSATRMSAQLRLMQLLSMQGRHDEWANEGQRFTGTYPTLERSRLIESRIARYRGELEREAQILLPLAEAATLGKDDVVALELIGELLTNLAYYDVPAHLLQRLRARYRDAARTLFPPLSAGDTQHPLADQRPLAAGYLVDFSLPFAADLIAGLASSHHRTGVNMTVYVVSPVVPALLDALLATGIRVVSVAAFDEQRAAQTIRPDNLDILVDVTAFGWYAKPGILSCRPARVQVAMPGFNFPVGIGELDYRFSDRLAELDGIEEQSQPAAIFIDGGVFPLLPAPQLHFPLTRSQLGIAESVPVFGIFASAARLSLRCVMTWKTLSERVPNAIFFVCPMQSADCDQIRRMLIVGGLDPANIATFPASQVRQRDLSLSGIVDVILDTTPGSDYFSARASLLGGIPLVTMPGRLFEERVALSLLSHLGNEAAFAASGRDYVDLAASLANDPEARQRQVASQSALVHASSLDDMNKYATNIEDALVLTVAGFDTVARRAEPVT